MGAIALNMLSKKFVVKKFYVVRSGLEPELFWTKTRRVANYTIGQSETKIWSAKLTYFRETQIICKNIKRLKFKLLTSHLIKIYYDACI